VLYDLCTHPTYIEAIRAEFAAFELESKHLTSKDRYRALQKLPLIDSFLRESARLHPATTSKLKTAPIFSPMMQTNSFCYLVGVRRKAVTPYSFSDGTHVAKGDWVCVPQQAIQRDPEYYRDAESFDGFRFVSTPSNTGDKKAEPKKREFTDIDTSFPFWGMGKRAWLVAHLACTLFVNTKTILTIFITSVPDATIQQHS
jgi:hypothetical protein